MIDGKTHPSKPLPEGGAVFSLRGNGFHTGRPNLLLFSRAPRGVCQVRIGSEDWCCLDPSPKTVRTDLRCTMLQGVGPLEHLGAALAILGVEGWVLEADHEDLPLFDGSSLAWAEAIRATGPTLSPSMVACPKTREWSDARGWIRVQPAQSFHLKVVWTKGELGEEVWEGDESNLVDLLAARTFVKTHEFVQARAAGLLLGVTPESGRLLRGSLEHHQEQSLVAELGVSVGDRAWTGGDPRLNGECAAHKALDILGDLYWSMGGLPLASIEAMDTGHALHWRVGQDLADRTVAP